jgi:hypothetical protein
MINPSQIEAFIAAKPFRTFAVETLGGNFFAVQSPAHIAMPPPGFDTLIIFGQDGLVHYVTQDSILSAAVYGPTPYQKEAEK